MKKEEVLRKYYLTANLEIEAMFYFREWNRVERFTKLMIHSLASTEEITYSLLTEDKSYNTIINTRNMI